MNANLHPDVAELLLSAEQIAARTAELAGELERDYAGRSVKLVCILKGAVPFAADLMRCLNLPITLDFIAISSYGASTKSSGVVRLVNDLSESIEGQDVVIVEDIVDSGLTLKYLRETLGGRGPRSLRVAVLLDKADRRSVDVPVEYVGFRIPDHFVVGYGLDYAGLYRNLPYIGVLRPEVYGATS